MVPPPPPPSSSSPSLASLLNPSPPSSHPHHQHHPNQHSHHPTPPNSSSIHFLTSQSDLDPLQPTTFSTHSRPLKRPRLLPQPFDQTTLPSSNGSSPNSPKSSVKSLPLTEALQPHPSHSFISEDPLDHPVIPHPLRSVSVSIPSHHHTTSKTPDHLHHQQQPSAAHSLASTPVSRLKSLGSPRSLSEHSITAHRSASQPLVTPAFPSTQPGRSPVRPSTTPHLPHPLSPSLHTPLPPDARSSPFQQPALTPLLTRRLPEQHPVSDSPHVATPNPAHELLSPIRRHSESIRKEEEVRVTKSMPRAGSTSQSAPDDVPVIALEESIFGIGPYDDFVAEVGRFIWNLARPHWLRNEGHLIEVEAKLGILRPRGEGGGERMYFPIGCDTPLIDNDGTRFETNMSLSQHKAFNALLNERVMETNEAGYGGARIKYTHTKGVDEFYEGRVRVSRDQGTGEVRTSIVKEKLGSLDITCPRRLFDFRVSVNLERPVPQPLPEARPTYRRLKDRLSYEHQICQVDLTQVKTDEPNVGLQHELEIEIRDVMGLLERAERWSDGNGDPEYLTYLQVWLNNVRLLIRNAVEE